MCFFRRFTPTSVLPVLVYVLQTSVGYIHSLATRRNVLARDVHNTENNFLIHEYSQTLIAENNVPLRYCNKNF